MSKTNRIKIGLAQTRQKKPFESDHWDVELEKEVNGEDLSKIASQLFEEARRIIEEQKPLNENGVQNGK